MFGLRSSGNIWGFHFLNVHTEARDPSPFVFGIWSSEEKFGKGKPYIQSLKLEPESSVFGLRGSGRVIGCYTGN